MKKANHFLNISAAEKPLPKELIRNKELLRNFLHKMYEFKEFSSSPKNVHETQGVSKES